MKNGESPADAAHVAVIDIGSNSIRLVVYEALSRAPLPRFNEKSLCALGSELRQTGRIHAEAAACAVNAVARFTAIAKAMECERIDLLATEALRRAANGAEILADLEAAAGRSIRVLTGDEEAYFAARGVVSGFYRPSGLVGDLGGGSLDLAEVNGARVGDRRETLALGSLPSTAILDPAGGESPKKAVDAIIGDHLARFISPKVFYLVGGSWRALAQMHMMGSDAPLSIPHGYSVDAREFRRFAKTIWRMPPDQLAAMPGCSSRRLPHVRGAALALDRVLKKLNAERVQVSALGLREGWLFDLLPEALQEGDALIEGARAFGRLRARVPDFADALMRWTDGLFPDETETERRLRQAACELSDIGWSDNAKVRAQLTLNRLLHFPFVAIDHAERVFLAAVIHARYHGDLDDPLLQPFARLLNPARLQRAQVLGRAMLAGHRLSGSVPHMLDRARLRLDPEAVVVEIDDEHHPDSDAVRNRLKQLARAIGVRGAEVEQRQVEP